MKMERVAGMSENRSEEQLLAACRTGDGEAFEALFRAHHKRVYSIALNFFGGDAGLAADVAQQVFLKIFSKIDDFRAESGLTTWIYRVTVNCCIDEQRRRRRFFSLENFFGEARPRRVPEDGIYEKEISGEVQRAVAALKPKYRLPIVLKYVENLSYQQIAEILGCSPGTVASRLSRGLKMLAARLGHLKGEI